MARRQSTFEDFMEIASRLPWFVGAGLAFLSNKLGSVGIDRMSSRDFEMLIRESFRQRGYDVVETGGNGADGGYDLILKKGGERFLVQCKQWRSRQVRVPIVRELFGVMAAEKAQGGFVVTSGTFTYDAKDFARGRNIELIDGAGLAKLFADKCEIAPSSASAPSCPRCGSEMVRREARKGVTAGQAFWGCRRFPACRVTQAID